MSRGRETSPPRCPRFMQFLELAVSKRYLTKQIFAGNALVLQEESDSSRWCVAIRWFREIMLIVERPDSRTENIVYRKVTIVS